MASSLTILYDGWSLARRPNSPAALHLIALLSNLPDQVQAVVALPEESFHPLPDGVGYHVNSMPEDEFSFLRWEQFVLPHLAKELGVMMLHTLGAHVPLFSQTPTVISPTGFSASPLHTPRGKDHLGLFSRVREAMSAGGMTRIAGVLWPDDLHAPDLPVPLRALPPVVHPAFTSDQANLGLLAGLELPVNYLLYHGPQHPPELHDLLEAWSWAAGSIGDFHPLLLLGLDPGAQRKARLTINEYHLEETVRLLPILPVDEMAALYQGCSALFHPAPVSPWGGPVRLAMISGKPVIALEDDRTDALVGPAAYLVPGEPSAAETLRKLGAALVTVVVEESVAEPLSKAARKRAAAWANAHFGHDLLAAYRSLLAF